MPDAVPPTLPPAPNDTIQEEISTSGIWRAVRRKVTGAAGTLMIISGGLTVLVSGSIWLTSRTAAWADSRWLTQSAYILGQEEQDASHAEAREADAGTAARQIKDLARRIDAVESGLQGVQATLTKSQMVQAVDLCRKGRGRVILRITEGVQVCRFGRRPGDDDIPLTDTDALIDRVYGG